ncbi:MAG: threonine/serine exporter family protein [Ignavibacteria bacterium]|nr:threonine/serine exporter family protein [Ignavibacteria bacterium]
MPINISEKASAINSTAESALRAAIMVIEKGGSTEYADNVFRRIISKSGAKDVAVMWRLDNVIMSYSDGENTSTLVKPVKGIGTDLTAVSEIIELSEDIFEGKKELSSLNNEIERISRLKPLHSSLTLIITAAFAAAFYSKFHDGSIADVSMVFLSAVIGQTLRIKLKRKEMNDGMITLICGLLSAGITSIVLHLGYGKVDMPTMIGSLIYLVPGLLMINAFVDMTRQKFIFIGTQRIVNALFLFMILALDILVAYTFIKL